MKRHSLSITLMFVFGVLLVTPVLLADGRRCTNRNIAGDWGYTATGIRTGVGPVAAVGTFTIDPDGNVAGKQTISLNGLVVEETFSGPYVLNEDCTGTVTVHVVSPVLNRTSHLSFVDVDNINEERAIFTDQGTIITLEAKRLFSRSE